MGAPKREGDELSGSTKRAKMEKKDSMEQNGKWTLPHDIEKVYPEWGRPELDTSGDIRHGFTSLWSKDFHKDLKRFYKFLVYF